MPISSTVDYLPVMDEFIHHWADLNLVVKLPWGNSAVGLLEFRELRAELDTAKAALRRRLNDLSLARGELDIIRGTAGERIAEFNRRIRAEFPVAGEFSRLPAVPARMAGRGAFLDGMDDALALWKAANERSPGAAAGGPLLLRGGLSLKDFRDLRAALDRAFAQRGTSEAALFEQRLERQDLQGRAKALMTLYRRKVEALYALDSPQVITLPRLTPKPRARKKPAPAQENGIGGLPDAGRTWTGGGTGEVSGKSTQGGDGKESQSSSSGASSAVKPLGSGDFPLPSSLRPLKPEAPSSPEVPLPPGPVMSWTLRIGPGPAGGAGEGDSMFVLPLRAVGQLTDESPMPPPRRKRRRRAGAGLPAAHSWRRGMRAG